MFSTSILSNLVFVLASPKGEFALEFTPLAACLVTTVTAEEEELVDPVRGLLWSDSDRLLLVRLLISLGVGNPDKCSS